MSNDKYITLLNEKQKLLKDILEYTKNKTFKISEDEVERIEYYLNKRQEMYNKLLDIENKIKNMKLNNINNKEVSDIIKKNDILIREILNLDEQRKKLMQSILNLIKKEIKSVKNMSKANDGYFGVYQNTVGGSLFDSSR